MERLTQSVGKGGANAYQDVCVTQLLINCCAHVMGPVSLLKVDGKIGPMTVSLIEAFQNNVMSMAKPDGRVDPGGNTLRQLNLKRAAQPKEKNSFRFPQIETEYFKPKLPRPHKFPLSSRPTQSYKEGMRAFGGSRSKGRKHAGCDLYAPIGTAIYAMADGVILKPRYAFYLGTFALEVKHDDFVARYGELGGAGPKFEVGSTVKRGDLIGYVGKLRGLNMSMLHLELYSGKSEGGLTNRSNPPFMRRNDLIDPTPILDKAE